MDEFDDVDRLAGSDPAITTYESYRNGFELFERKLRKELDAFGLERIEPAGDPFDPAIHEAVAVVAPEAPGQDNTVKATFQVGYRFKGAVLRPARVQVYSEQGTA
jgi:molecular chaperone GrpE